MGFNLSTFRCGLTLLDTDLNAIVNAINSIYNAQGIYIDSNSNSIKLTDNSNGNITKSELLTFLGISGSNEDYIPISGSDDISGSLIPDGSDNYNLGDKNNYWKDIYTSTEHTKILKFHSQQLTYESLGELYVGKDTSNNNETILHFKHGNDNEEIVATRDWVNSLLNPTKINIGSTGSISEELYNDKSNYIKIESSSNNPIVIAGYDENSVPTGIKFGDASTGDVLTVYNEKIYINGDLFGGENGVSVLNDLSNVSVATPGTGLFLMYNGKSWVSDDLPESLIKHPGDVSINEEYYLKYEVDDEHPSGWYSWVERPSGAKELNELNDVEINDTKLELGQVLVYSQVTDEENNTCNSWVNKTVSGVLTYNQDDHDKYLRVKSNGTGTEWVNGIATGVSSINNITGDVTITGSGVSINNNTITITGGGGGLTSGSWAAYFDGQQKSIQSPASGLYLKWGSDGNLTQDSGSYTLTAATDRALGGIEIGYDESNSGTTKNYAVKLDSNNKAYVNVPWATSNLTLSGLIGSSSIGGQTTPIYWDGSAFQTCNTQTSGITSISVGTASLSLTPSSGSVTIPSLTSSNSTEYGVIKANGSFNAPNYPVKTNNSGSAYITLAIDDLIGSNAVGNSSTPIYWDGSAFSTCSTSTGGGVTTIQVDGDLLIKNSADDRYLPSTSLTGSTIFLKASGITKLAEALNYLDDISITKKYDSNGDYNFIVSSKLKTVSSNSYIYCNENISVGANNNTYYFKKPVIYIDSNWKLHLAIYGDSDYWGFPSESDTDGISNFKRRNDGRQLTSIASINSHIGQLLSLTIKPRLTALDNTHTYSVDDTSFNTLTTQFASTYANINTIKFI